MIYDAVIMRTIVDLPEDQVRALGKLCQAEGISRAEAVRRALGEMLARRGVEGREQAFGAWRQRGDSRQMVESLRCEWDE